MGGAQFARLPGGAASLGGRATVERSRRDRQFRLGG